MLEVSIDTPTRTTITQNQRKILKKRLCMQTRSQISDLRSQIRRRNVEISDSAHTLDPFSSVRQQSDLFAQIADMSVDAAIKRREFAAEHITRQLLAADNLTGGVQQHFEQVKLDGRKTDRFTAATHHATAWIHFDVADHDWRRGRMISLFHWPGPAKNRPNARREFLRIEGLWQIIIRAHLQTQHAIERITFRC